ncbi:MAG: polysaccharide biosynthesis protein, partial [Planctomycetota bacterium]
GMPVLAHEAVPEEYEGKRILITGALGSLGYALWERLKDVAHVVGIDHDEYRVSENRWCLLGDFGDFTPEELAEFDYVYHAAAYKHVTLAEIHKHAYSLNNWYKTSRLINGLALRTRCILVSTDKAAGPSHMGFTKRMAEQECENLGHVSLRLVNVIDSRGNVFDHWEHDIPPMCGPRTTVRYWSQLSDAVTALLRVGLMTSGTYTIWGMPLLPLGEFAKVYEEKGIVFEDMTLREGEVDEENLCNPETEKLEDTGCSYLKKIVSL